MPFNILCCAVLLVQNYAFSWFFQHTFFMLLNIIITFFAGLNQI
jgi:hypothetical protein